MAEQGAGVYEPGGIFLAPGKSPAGYPLCEAERPLVF